MALLNSPFVLNDLIRQRVWCLRPQYGRRRDRCVGALDDNGAATVTLPDWFEPLNRDFRYQLTCIGGYAPVYIAQEIQDGSAGPEIGWWTVDGGGYSLSGSAGQADPGRMTGGGYAVAGGFWNQASAALAWNLYLPLVNRD